MLLPILIAICIFGNVTQATEHLHLDEDDGDHLHCVECLLSPATKLDANLSVSDKPVAATINTVPPTNENQKLLLDYTGKHWSARPPPSKKAYSTF